MEDHSFDHSFHAVFSMSSDALVVIHEKTLGILQANPAALRLYGYSGKELSEKYYTELSDDPILTQKIIAEGYSYYSNQTHIQKNGKPFIADICYGRISLNNTKYVLVNIRVISPTNECLELFKKTRKPLITDISSDDNTFEEAFIQGEESERMRIAKDLHDHIGQLMVSAKYTLERYFFIQTEQEKAECITKTIDQLSNTIVEIRNVSRNVITGFIKEKSFEKAIISLVQDFAKTGKIKIHFRHTDIPNDLSATAQINIYRIIEEILSNTLKHSGATSLHISIGVEKKSLYIKTLDNGAGIQSHPTKDSFGLTIMRHRVEQLEGRFHFSSFSGKSFESIISIPLKNCYQKAFDRY